MTQIVGFYIRIEGREKAIEPISDWLSDDLASQEFTSAIAEKAQALLKQAGVLGRGKVTIEVNQDVVMKLVRERSYESKRELERTMRLLESRREQGRKAEEEKEKRDQELREEFTGGNFDPAQRRYPPREVKKSDDES